MKSKAGCFKSLLSNLCQLPKFWESKARSTQQHSSLQHKVPISEDKQAIYMLFPPLTVSCCPAKHNTIRNKTKPCFILLAEDLYLPIETNNRQMKRTHTHTPLTKQWLNTDSVVLFLCFFFSPLGSTNPITRLGKYRHVCAQLCAAPGPILAGQAQPVASRSKLEIEQFNLLKQEVSKHLKCHDTYGACQLNTMLLA